MKVRFSPAFPERSKHELRLGGTNGRIDGGLNLADLPHTLDLSQSPDCCNVWFYEGTITKRWGQRMVGALNAEMEITAAVPDGAGNVLLQAGTGLFRMNLESGVSAGIGTLQNVGGEAPKGTFFRYGDAVYFLNGVEFLVSTGGDFGAVTPYVPIVFSGRSPSGSVPGEVSGSYNLLTNRYRIAFSGDGSSTVYTIPAGYTVDTPTVTVTVDGVTMTENSGFTVNRANQNVIFSAAPAAGINNVVFTFTRTGTVPSAGVLACRRAIVYAGDSRVMLGGNGTNTLYYSQQYEPTYFPL